MIKDKELLLSLISISDEEAFRKLYVRYKTKLWYYCYGFTKSEEATDDIVQEVFIRIWEIRNFIDPELSFSAFIYTIARNRVLNYFRDINIEEQVKKTLMKNISVKDETTSNDIVYAEYRKIFAHAIEKLPSQRKKIFKMSRIDNLSHKEIANQLNISVNTVQEHISESLRFIKSYFTKHTDLTWSIVCLLFIHMYC